MLGKTTAKAGNHHTAKVLIVEPITCVGMQAKWRSSDLELELRALTGDRYRVIASATEGKGFLILQHRTVSVLVGTATATMTLSDDDNVFVMSTGEQIKREGLLVTSKTGALRHCPFS